MRLTFVFNCKDDEINYELPDGSNANPNAPADDHCNVFHPSYGGASPCGITENPSCDLTTLSIGESCGGIVYAGESDGNRIYTHRADHGTGISWNNGTATYTTTGATSWGDGETNTDTLVGLSNSSAPYKAAQLCRTQGTKWYLPARNELNLLYSNRATINGFSESSYYWSSTEGGGPTLAFSLYCPLSSWNQRMKTNLYRIRCVRRD